MTRRNLFQNGLAFLICLFLFAGVSAQTKKAVQVKNSGTWTVPTTLEGKAITVTSVTFEAWGGGGAGGFTTGGHPLTDMYVSGGGGGGAYGKTVINDPVAGEEFTITVGAGGYNTADDDNSITCPFACFENYRQADGGMSSVKRGSTTILEALGGKTCAGQDNTIGADGGAATGAGDLHYAGGKGGNASQDCTLAGRRSSGSGGGAAGPNGNGGNADNATCSANGGWKAGGTAGGGLAGKGGEGTSDHNDVFGGKPVGNPGINYGGGGAGSKTYRAWHSGGNGAPGIVLVTYTYTSTETIIDVDDETASFCSGTAISIPLNVTLTNVAPADVTVESISTSDLANETIAYDAVEGKFFFTADAYTNTTNTTKTFTLTCKLKDNTTVESNEFTVTVNVYGKLDGGVIAKDQFVCADQTIDILKGDGSVVTDGWYYSSVTTALATGGSGSGSYQWYVRNMLVSGSDFEAISGANNVNYMPGNGSFRFMRKYTDDVCGSAWATDGYGENYLQVVTVNPLELNETGFSEVTICSNENYTHSLGFEGTSPAAYYFDHYYLQLSTDEGSNWTNVSTDASTISLTPTDFSAGDDIWYRFTYEFGDCDPVPGNAIHKIHVKEIPDYTGQFPDVNITLWYGACDTSIAALVPPVLTPTPASITRADSYGDRLTPGEYELRWNVIADDCNIPVEYTQNVKVEYPACGTLAEPLPMTDNDGNEYQTIRIGCECWMAENLRANAPEAVYYNEDPANEQFGKLYTWADAVGCNETPKETMSGATYVQGILPDEWSIPTMAQYTKLLEYFNTEQLKSDEADSWLPDYLGTNESGFNLMGSGYYDVEFQRLRGYADLWVVGVTSSNPDKAPVAEFRYDCDGTINCVFVSKTAKMSVRGVRVSPAVQPFTCGTSKMKDADGNEYETVEIGTQCWTKSNLRSTKDKNGNDLVNGGTTASMTDPYYYVNSSVDASVYGHYYNWEAAKLVCPTGWHLPSHAEWTTLTNYVKANYSCDGNVLSIAKALASTDGWKSTNGICCPGDQSTYANNETGFSAFPAGYFNPDYSSFSSKSERAVFSSSDLDTICDPSSTTNQQNRTLLFKSVEVWQAGCYSLDRGMSVRCVKD